jgi:hypothetical protein
VIGAAEAPQLRRPQRRLADLQAARSMAMEGAEPVLLHQAGHAMLAARLARLPQIKEYAWRPGDALPRLE